MDNVPQEKFRKSLRTAAINYRNGYFFVTCQVAHNKSIFGTIVGERCELNSIGRMVEEYWRGLPAKYPELELDEFVVMPNHFHAIVRIHYRATNREQHLGFLMGRFKGGTGYATKAAPCFYRRSRPIRASTKRSPHGAMNTCCAIPMKFGPATFRPTACFQQCWLHCIEQTAPHPPKHLLGLYT